MKTTAPICIWDVAAELGEGPIWSDAERSVYFVDIKSQRVHRLNVDSRQASSWAAPAQPGFLAPLADGGLASGLEDGIYRFDTITGAFLKIIDVESNIPGNRLNDGYVDRRGRLWFGSMDDSERQARGTLYRVQPNGRPIACDTGYVITNGPAVSPDGRVMYHADTLNRVIYAFDVDEEGMLARKRRFVSISGGGYPDGMAVDANGFVWVALFGGARIERFSPDGALTDQIHFPCDNVTKLVFGGDDLRTVYVTTARKGLSNTALQRQPHAGGLFEFRADVPGQPQAFCTEGFCNE
ncbi:MULTISPECIES: SMP-30/gluconolactonase/LRE family protein [Burkholderia]|uniref:Gluconolaconase n=1 Tax=Burkholderia savannae TaxID=1637837 RepID=A0ABR5TDJ9_9BURK|nr:MULTISPECIES: SMP-30/gluconolactonase/LRE family protein [Burkholderia]AOJ68836.1 gluconolaconase [Burkholderia savannae]AOJ80814.1 gluconolaconase [Burkholderia savannae]AOK47053.1 gluconolaconase [Burkholderia sp. MSMB617WGS]KGS08742.1 SMP-30/Gluconolaconase/LRE-like region family protein [Burkholderia sp. ABCPW 111]KVG45705.1 gluconolaconase [Burkholderia sp. MSMB0265]